MLLLSKSLDDDATLYYANEVLRSGYNLGFLGVRSPILELELEDRLVKAITRFLMELGNSFTFIDTTFDELDGIVTVDKI